jgi:hypothetical protein
MFTSKLFINSHWQTASPTRLKNDTCWKIWCSQWKKLEHCYNEEKCFHIHETRLQLLSFLSELFCNIRLFTVCHHSLLPFLSAVNVFQQVFFGWRGRKEGGNWMEMMYVLTASMFVCKTIDSRSAACMLPMDF